MVRASGPPMAAKRDGAPDHEGQSADEDADIRTPTSIRPGYPLPDEPCIRAAEPRRTGRDRAEEHDAAHGSRSRRLERRVAQRDSHAATVNPHQGGQGGGTS